MTFRANSANKIEKVMGERGREGEGKRRTEANSASLTNPQSQFTCSSFIIFLSEEYTSGGNERTWPMINKKKNQN